MQVKDIMTTDVATVQSDTPLTDVVRLFRAKAISGVPVLDEVGSLVGIVTEVDLIARHARPHFPAYIQFLDSVIYLESPRRYRESMRHILATKAGELMSFPVRTVSPETEIQDLAAFMIEHRVNPVPVVDEDGRLVGIVSHTDLLDLIVRSEASADEAEATPDGTPISAEDD